MHNLQRELQEVMVASATTIFARTLMWMTTSPFDYATILENQEMVAEKVVASVETAFEVQRVVMLQMMGAPVAATEALHDILAPIHRKVTANADRLTGGGHENKDV